MGVLTRDGRISIAEGFSIRSIYVAWGVGDGEWVEEVPAPSTSAVELIDEIGRLRATSVAFATPDDGGTVVLPGGEKFAVSETPTEHLLITANFDFGHASSAVIREIGIFVDGETDDGLPGGQVYFTPAEVVGLGRLLHVENISPIYRSPAVRESFQTVISF